MGCMQNRIGECGTVCHRRLSEPIFTPLLRFLQRASVVSHLVKVAGIRNTGKGEGPCQAPSVCVKQLFYLPDYRRLSMKRLTYIEHQI